MDVALVVVAEPKTRKINTKDAYLLVDRYIAVHAALDVGKIENKETKPEKNNA